MSETKHWTVGSIPYTRNDGYNIICLFHSNIGNEKPEEKSKSRRNFPGFIFFYNTENENNTILKIKYIKDIIAFKPSIGVDSFAYDSLHTPRRTGAAASCLTLGFRFLLKYFVLFFLMLVAYFVLVALLFWLVELILKMTSRWHSNMPI